MFRRSVILGTSRRISSGNIQAVVQRRGRHDQVGLGEGVPYLAAILEQKPPLQLDVLVDGQRPS